MRLEKVGQILRLARLLASSAGGLTLDEMGKAIGEERRTVERMRDIIRDVFPQFEDIPDHPQRRFRIPGGLDGFFQDPTVEELACLGTIIEEMKGSGAAGRAALLTELDRKIRGAMRINKRMKAETDIEALMRAEMIAVQAGPQAAEKPALLSDLRRALLGWRRLRFIYTGGSTPGRERHLVPYGIIFGRCKYLIGAEVGFPKIKSWRLDRIERLDVLDETEMPPLDFKLSEFAAGMFGYFDEPPQAVVLHVLPGGMEDFKNFRFHASQTVQELSDGSALVRFRASGMQELVWHLFSWGSKIEIIEPVSLRQSMTSDLTEALAHHREPLRYEHIVNPATAAAKAG